MYKYFPLLIPIFLLSYIDSDMDGVEDKDDLCPNTLITNLVDTTGCSIKSLISPHHFSLTAGTSLAKDINSTYNFSTLELDYYYQNISLQLSSSYYNFKNTTLNENGINDTNLNFFYKFYPKENFMLTVATGISFPTYYNSDNKTDYSTSITGYYYLEDLSFSTGFGYKIIGDTNSSNVFFYNINTGYTWNSKYYYSIGYYVSESIYNGIENFKSIALYNHYSINKKLFTILSLSKGLSNTSLDESIGVKLGYYW